ncbi:MAG: tetratricopeptide repeat protein [Candidatus Aminicenantes bacterium]|nr:MAG: tetratricopeptide repeat protein [Candidatus Aminicenantes bacterium]
MKIIKIIGREKVEYGVFRAELVFPSENRFDVTVRDPFLESGEIESDQDELLWWYFEKHLESPFTDREKAKRAVNSIAFYGESLFGDLFAQDKALAEWRKLVHGLDKVRVQVLSKDPELQAFHWEALKDPKERKAFCLKGVEFTRTSNTPTWDLTVQESTCLNLLLVTARPHGKEDLEYRTITRPVIDTIERNRMPVHVHLLRPPTFLALKEHLREKKGFYHIVHFDVHGSVLSFPVYQLIMEQQGKNRSRGHRWVDPYEGTQAFIDLLGEGGGHDLVAALDIAELLREAHVPVCFLNACHSAMATWRMSESKEAPGGKSLTRNAPLAMALLEQGVRLVLGMAWSLTVPGAQVMMTTLYNTLTKGENLGTALNLARQAMFDDGCRFLSSDLSVFLEDWLLPVVWGKGDFELHLQLKEPGAEEKAALLEQKQQREKELEGVKTQGEYGFLGRDVDILSIESMLLERNVLLIKGMGGTGKTTLLGHMAEWWLKTGWVEHVFYFGYDRKPYRAEEILNTIAKMIMPRGEYGSFLVTPEVEKKAMALVEFLKESKDTPKVLLILDNMESVTGATQAVGSRLSKKDQGIMSNALKALMHSSIKILLGSRSDEAWLRKDTFTDNVYVLEGLDHVSRFQLAEKIVKDVVIDDRGEFNRLMDILAGYPLAIEIILPNLGHRSAKELREMLTGVGVDLKGGRVSEEIFKCINISFSLLTPRARESMLVFAPFTSFLNAAGLEQYLNELQNSDVFSNLTLADLEEALSQGLKQGLLKERFFHRCFSIQPVFPFFLGQQVEQCLDEKRKVTLEQAFCNYMVIIANTYNFLMESKEAGKKQSGFLLFQQDRENLYKTLHWVLDKEGDYYPLYFVFSQFYHQQPLYQEAIEFMEGVVKKLDLYSKKGKTFLIEYASVVGNLGNNYQRIKNFSKARNNFKKALTLLQQVGTRQMTASPYYQLGYVAQEERDWKEAKRNYKKALKIYQEFNDSGGQARTYHQLGMVAQEEQDWKNAKRNYHESLKIFQESNDRYNQAKGYHQLGMVAQAERNWDEAKRNYQEALRIDQEFNDRYSQARVYHHLGNVAREEGDWQTAKRDFQKALSIFQEFNDRYNQAQVFQSLGVAAVEEMDYVSSLGYYATALEIFLQYNDEYHTQKTFGNLSWLVQQWDATEAIDELTVEEKIKELLRKILKETKKKL